MLSARRNALPFAANTEAASCRALTEYDVRRELIHKCMRACGWRIDPRIYCQKGSLESICTEPRGYSGSEPLVQSGIRPFVDLSFAR